MFFGHFILRQTYPLGRQTVSWRTELRMTSDCIDRPIEVENYLVSHFVDKTRPGTADCLTGWRQTSTEPGDFLRQFSGRNNITRQQFNLHLSTLQENLSSLVVTQKFQGLTRCTAAATIPRICLLPSSSHISLRKSTAHHHLI